MLSAGENGIEADDNFGTTTRRARWWLEWEVGLLVLLVLGVYFSRLTSLTVRGEESRWARVAVEMIESGDWVVPRQQGQPFYSRPPLQSWTIALVGLVSGKVDVVAIRLPSVLAILLTVLLIYGYSRSFLSRLGALVAAGGFATMGQVMELGRLGESDAVFTLLVGGSLLVWHWGRVRGWPAAATWSFAYLLVALATLTKGLQAPVYFAVSVAAFLLLTRRWRDVFTRSHLVGISVFLAVWGAWQVPFFLEMGWDGVRRIYGHDVALRFEDSSLLTILKHLVTYPVEVVFGCLLPWSVLLIAYLDRDFRRTIGSARPHVLFLGCCIATTFTIVWLVPGARSRYFMPLYPCFAPLLALAAQRCWETDRTLGWQKLWSRYLSIAGVLMFVAGIVILAATLLDDGWSQIGQPLWFAVFYLTASTLLALATLWSRHAAGDLQRVVGVLSVAVFLGLTFTGVVINSQMRHSEHAAEAVAELKRQLPPGARLVSFGPVFHLFAYHYGRPIELLPMPGQGEQPDADVTYFCSMREVNFPYEKLAVICCDRNRHSKPCLGVIVGRRLPTRQAKAGCGAATRRQ